MVIANYLFLKKKKLFNYLIVRYIVLNYSLFDFCNLFYGQWEFVTFNLHIYIRDFELLASFLKEIHRI